MLYNGWRWWNSSTKKEGDLRNRSYVSINEVSFGAGETLLGVVSAYCYETLRRMEKENLHHFKHCGYYT
jgi:hypothetical protein